ncbi:hypothetical protein NHH88_11155 [Oxalobacteraceae bacterium OTU3CAMAD1]|nr:hypothetical protein NHH88_11155 [Oxalobacteraceae bacterium OTU3CAMAD1]
MNVKNPVSHRPLGSDLARVDAHEIQPHEYEEIPELTEEMLAIAVIKKPAGRARSRKGNSHTPTDEVKSDEPL